MKRLILVTVSGASLFCFAVLHPRLQAETIILEHCRSATSIAIQLNYQEQRDIQTTSPALHLKTHSSQDKQTHVFAEGPVLGSMDARDIQFVARCPVKGLDVTATIVRSAEYQGAVAKYVSWRPLLELTISGAKPKTRLAIHWVMKTTDGNEVRRGGLPTGSVQQYPIDLSLTLP